MAPGPQMEYQRPRFQSPASCENPISCLFFLLGTKEKAWHIVTNLSVRVPSFIFVLKRIQIRNDDINTIALTLPERLFLQQPQSSRCFLYYPTV